MASISWEQERLLVTEVTNLIDIFNAGKASDRNQMGIVGSYSFARRKHRIPPQAQECFDAGLLTAVGKPTFAPFPSPLLLCT